jgi:hypothetical protein
MGEGEGATLNALRHGIEPRRDAASVGRRWMQAGSLGRGTGRDVTQGVEGALVRATLRYVM